MSGIYFHIPYCKRKCNYCSFFTSTCLKSKKELIKAELKELILRKEYLNNETIETIYFGGGTPSILDEKDIENLINAIHKHYKTSNNPEITIECNPEDITIEKLNYYKNLGINRLSVGIQSFNENSIKSLNRSNTINDINNSLMYIKKTNFSNYNLDIIFGIFNESIHELEYNINKLLTIRPTHISTYCLTIEPKTLFNYLLNKKIISEKTDDEIATQFEYIHNTLTKNGYIHYEISNYCLKGFESKHNLGYWNDKTYLGIGPSAHSYNKISRQYNVQNIYNYINSINQNNIPATIEILTNEDKINEYILTHLRTNIGLNKNYLKNKYNYTLDKDTLKILIENNLIKLENDVITLTLKGMLISNSIISKLFI